MSIGQNASALSPDGETLQAAGFDPALRRKLEAGIEAGLLRDLHVVLAARHADRFRPSASSVSPIAPRGN